MNIQQYLHERNNPLFLTMMLAPLRHLRKKFEPSNRTFPESSTERFPRRGPLTYSQNLAEPSRNFQWNIPNFSSEYSWNGLGIFCAIWVEKRDLDVNNCRCDFDLSFNRKNAFYFEHIFLSSKGIFVQN